MSPTARTLEWLRRAGYSAGVVEKWIPQMRRRVDLFGCIDIVAVGGGETGALGVQATSGSNHASRVAKILAIPEAEQWVEAGNRLWVMSWAKRGQRGKAKRWEPRIETVTIGMFEEARCDTE